MPWPKGYTNTRAMSNLCLVPHGTLSVTIGQYSVPLSRRISRCYCQVYVGESCGKVRELCISSVKRGWVPRAGCQLCPMPPSSLPSVDEEPQDAAAADSDARLSLSRANYKLPTNSRLSELI